MQWCHPVQLTQHLILCYLGEVFAYLKVVELNPKFIPKVFLQPFAGNTAVPMPVRVPMKWQECGLTGFFKKQPANLNPSEDS